jgi:NTP pyrophosphatase (non-canonical NTP hydrolase)
MIGTLSELLEKQRRLMEVLNIDPSSGTLTINDMPSKSEMGAGIGMVMESAEVLEAMDKANRVWKVKEGLVIDQVKEEVADVLFFVLELTVLLRLTGDDLAYLYSEKYKKNLLRILKATPYPSGGVNGQLVTLMDECFGYEETERLVKKVLDEKREAA